MKLKTRLKINPADFFHQMNKNVWSPIRDEKRLDEMEIFAVCVEMTALSIVLHMNQLKLGTDGALKRLATEI